MSDHNKTFGRRFREEKGQAFVLVLILMLASALMITPLLSFMYSGRVATTRNEVRMKELYSADAGIEYGMQLLQKKTGVDPQLPMANGEKASYSPLDPNLNGRVMGSTWITCQDVDTGLYRIKASAVTTLPTTPGTSIDSLVRLLTFRDFTENAITGNTGADVTLKPGTTVIGPIQLEVPPGSLDDKSDEEDQHPHENTPVTGWPTDQEMIDFYGEDVEGAPAWPYGNPVWVNSLTPSSPTPTDPNIVGPNYYDGDLSFNNKKTVGHVYFDNVTGGHGTLFVNGDLAFAQPSDDYTVHLNGQTIFATGDISFSAHKVNLQGPGAIIALGNVDFQPAIEGTDFVFVMSVNGSVHFAPTGDFHGSVAGEVSVEMWPGNQFIWSSPPPTLNVPWEHADRNIIHEIVTWNIGNFSDTEPFILTSSLRDAGVGLPYSDTLVAIGGTTPYKWTVVSGSGDLPDGLELNSDNGTISGTPTTAGLFHFKIKLVDDRAESVTRDMSIYVNAVTITTIDLPAGHVGTLYDELLEAVGLATPFSWSVLSGSLPPGLTLADYDNTRARIWGTPSTAGMYGFEVKVTDSATPPNTYVKSFQLAVHPLPVVTTGAATGIGMSWTLNGSLDFIGSETGGEVFFRWDLGETPHQAVAATGSFSATLGPTDGLSHGTTYHYRAVFHTNDGADVEGAEMQFTP